MLIALAIYGFLAVVAQEGPKAPKRPDPKTPFAEVISLESPKLFEQMQAPNPVHLGGARYKLYFNNRTTLRGQPADPVVIIKPLKVFYADGKLTGNPAAIEFEDWEPAAYQSLASHCVAKLKSS